MKLSSTEAVILVDEEGRNAGHNFGRGPSKDHCNRVQFALAQQFQTKGFSSEFTIRSYVKLSLAVVAILVGGQGMPDTTLVEDHLRTKPSKLGSIGSVVSDKIFLNEFPIRFYEKLCSSMAAIQVWWLGMQYA